MSFTIDDFRNLIRILGERPEWREELRRLVLTDELLSLPEQIARLQHETNQRFQELATQVTQLVEAQRRTEEQVAELTRVVGSLTDDVGELKGKILETDYRTKVFAYFGPLLRRVHALSQDELAALLDDGIDAGLLSATEAQEIALANVIVRGKRRQDGVEVYLVIEVSWGVGGVGPGDVERAVRRAGLFSRTGVTAVPVIAGRRVTAEAARLARTEQVWQLTNGYAVPPESTVAPS